MTTQPTVLLTLEDVDRWREELRLARQQQVELMNKIGILERKIEFAQMFVSESVGAKVIAKVVENGHAALKDTSGITMFDAIRRVIHAAGRPLEPREISSAIKCDSAMPEKIRNSHPNYLYTALMRMKDQSKLIKDSKGRYSIPQNE